MPIGDRTWRICGLAVIVAVIAAGTPGASAQQPPPVDVATPLVARIADWDEFTGRFEAVQRAELRARVSGYLQKINFRDGQIVRQGDTLFVIDPRPLDAAYQRVLAELKAAQAQQTLASTALGRGEALVKQRTLARSALDERRAAKLTADAQVAVANAALREAALNVEFTAVKAPFTGRMSDSRVDIGNLVLTGETVLAILVSTDPIHLVFTASEADFLKYTRLNMSGARPSSRDAPNPVQAQLIDETGWPHRGRMDFVSNELDRGTGTITGRAVFENPNHLLTPGLFARIRLLAASEYEALLIPDAAILSDQARKIVMVADSEGKVAAKVVTPGPLHRGLRVVRAGLTRDDRVVVNGVQRARPGGKVTPRDVTITLAEPVSD